MEEKIEIYKHIYKDSDMSVSSLRKMKLDLKNKDNKIKDYLDYLIDEFNKYKNISKDELTELNESLDEESFMAKLMSNIGIKKEVMNDNSDSHMAEVLIQGIVMGSINMEKTISKYSDKLDKADLSIAEEFLKFEQESIEKLKEYL